MDFEGVGLYFDPPAPLIFDLLPRLKGIAGAPAQHVRKCRAAHMLGVEPRRGEKGGL